ncbi:hypothetical protein HPB47_017668 [Ixodes persulcatus]|uniref:Uncharacterized protein n=1 Tax=Ixodes persulcatus TaxID=34615 RepID=A0AC60QQ11_IXOPE|nr:hypothetical protein HPB47_017668 [Ixodes persulcatus]
MERLQTKRLVTRAEIERLSEEIQAAMSIEDFRPHHEERLAEITDELDALARELKEQDALIEAENERLDDKGCSGLRRYVAGLGLLDSGELADFCLLHKHLDVVTSIASWLVR